MQQGRGHGRRHAVAHGAGSRRQLRAPVVLQTVIAGEPVQPDAEIAGPVGIDGVVGHMALDGAHHLGHVQRRHRRGHRIGLVVRPRRGRPVAPRHARSRGLDRGQRRAGGGQRRVEHQVGGIDAAQLLRPGVPVHQSLGRSRRRQQRIRAGGDLAQAHADGQHQVGVAHAGGQLRIDADAHVAGVKRMAVVERVLETEAASHGQLPRLGEALQTAAAFRRPAGAADHDEGSLGAQEQAAQVAQRAGRGPGLRRLHAREHRRGGGRGQHVFGQCQHHRAGTALHRRVERPRHVLRQAVGVLHLAHPLGHAERARAEHLAVVDLLEGLAVALIAGHLADEQHHRRGILEGRVQADGGIAGTWAARHEAHAGPVRELALRVSHERRAALVAAADEADAVAVLVQAVQHREVAFAGHAEHGVDALGDQGFDQGMAGRSRHHGGRHAAARRRLATRRLTSEAQVTPRTSAAAAPTNTPPAEPRSRMAPNTGADSAKPMSSPEYTVP